jgi:hypothetical protein
MIDLARASWGHDNPTFRQVFTSRFIPGGTQEQLNWFNDLCVKTTPPRSLLSFWNHAVSWTYPHYCKMWRPDSGSARAWRQRGAD